MATDAEEIAEVDVESHIVAYRHIFGDGYGDLIAQETRIEGWRQSIEKAAYHLAPDHILVSVDGSEVIGYVCFGRMRYWPEPDTGEIDALYVHPRRWRSGAGQALLTQALATLRTEGYREVILWALADNDIGRRFYEKEGWEPDGGERTPKHGKLEIRYRLVL